MAFKDYYKILNVEKTATPEAIKKSFRKLVVQHHPDKNKGDAKAEARFKEINEAYAVLSDADKRKRYDQFGENWEHFQADSGGRQGGAKSSRSGAGSAGSTFSFDANDFENDNNLDDLLRHFFGGGAGRSAGQRQYARGMDGSDLQAEVWITLEEAFTGVTKMLDIGAEKHRLVIKKGVEEGKQFRLPGRGQPGVNGGQPGDLFVTLRITPHLRFTRTGNDLRCRHHTDLYTAVLGGKIRIPTLHGDKMMTLPTGTQNGVVLRMRGLGMPDYDKTGVFGDLYVEIHVDIPKQLTPEEHQLFTRLAELKHDRKHAESV